MGTKRTECQNRYDKEHCVQFKMKYNRTTDAEIIEFLQALPNKQGFLRELLKKEIKRQKRAKKKRKIVVDNTAIMSL